MGHLGGQVGLVTGAGQGIGRASAVRLAEEGAAVAIVDIDGERATAAVAEITAAGGRAHAYVLDVADYDGMRGAIDEMVRRYGRFDILENNVAAFQDDIHAGDLDVVATPLSVWQRTMDVNLTGPMMATKYAIPHMLETSGRGCIINISSTAAFLGDVNHVAYKASKAGLQALTRSVATSHGKRGIRCNTIATGLILSPTAIANLSPEMLQVYEAHRLVQNVGTPEQIGALVAFLASEDASYLTGQTIVVDGGATAHQPWYISAKTVHPDCFGPDGLSGSLVVDQAPNQGVPA